MSELIVIGCERPEEAESIRLDLFSMDSEYRADIADAVVAAVDENGEVKLDQVVNRWSAGPDGRAFHSFLSGLIFIHPLRGALPGPTAGVLYWALGDYGLGSRFLAEVAEILKPGRAALFIFARLNAAGPIVERLAGMGRPFLRTELDHAQERKMRDAFAKAHAEAVRHLIESCERRADNEHGAAREARAASGHRL